MFRYFTYTVLLLVTCDIIITFKIPKDLTFLGCIFSSPAFNETSSLFPEAAVRSKIPVQTKDNIQYCKQKAKKNGNEVFGVDKDVCITGSKFKFALPIHFISKQKSKCKDKVKIFSLAGQLDGIKQLDEMDEQENKRENIAWLPTKRNLIEKPVEVEVDEDADLNLLVNYNFERIDPQSKYVEGWSCQGDRNMFTPMYRSSIIAKAGQFSGMCSNRDKKSYGPGQYIENAVISGEMYTIDGWTHLLNVKDLSEAASLELWIKYGSDNGEYHEKRLLARRDLLVINTDWQYWKAQFLLPSGQKYRSVFIYFQGPPKHVDIAIDNMEMRKIQKYDDFKKFSDKEIEKVRKRDVTVSIIFNTFKYPKKELENSRLEIKQISSDFGFGASADFKHLLNNDKYKSFLKHNFEWATMESSLKWNTMEKVKVKVLFKFIFWFQPINQDDLDEELKFDRHKNSLKSVVKHEDVLLMTKTLINEMGMLVRGHCVYWAIPEYNPAWLFELNTTDLKSSMNRRMRDVVWKYRNKFKHWDINNEMIHGSFYSSKLKPSIRNWMFKAAKHLDKDAQLFVNEFDVFASPTYTQSYVEHINNFISKGIPVQAIGVQGHFSGNVYPELLRERLDMLASTGLPIWITELDIKEEDENKRADSLEKILRTAFSHQSVSGVVLWTFWDKHSWRGNHTSLFTGENFLPNTVGRRYLNLRRQWRTPLTIIEPSSIFINQLNFKFRAFHGKYNIKLILPDHQIIEKVVYIENHWKELLIQFKTHIRGNS